MPTIHFQTQATSINGWTIVQLPKVASAKLPSRGQVMVKGTLNGSAFQTALEPDGSGGHWLHVDKNLQKSTKVSAGNSVTMAIEATKDWPEPTVPADWKAALRAHADITALWLDVTPMARWEWLRWINSTNQPGTRQRRIEVSMSKLRNGLRRPCCFNRNMCCVPDVSKNGVLLQSTATVQ